MAEDSTDSCSAAAVPAASDDEVYLPQPYKINGRFVVPWPGFKPPGPSGVVKYLAQSKDTSNIPPPDVILVTLYSC